MYSTLAGLGISINPLSAVCQAGKNDDDKSETSPLEPASGQQVVTILQTTDVHCQLHPHDELF